MTRSIYDEFFLLNLVFYKQLITKYLNGILKFYMDIYIYANLLIFN